MEGLGDLIPVVFIIEIIGHEINAKCIEYNTSMIGFMINISGAILLGIAVHGTMCLLVVICNF